MADKKKRFEGRSECFQDYFTLQACYAATKTIYGTYLEVGGQNVTEPSNTKGLEEAGWTGISVNPDIDREDWIKGRSNFCYFENAAGFDFRRAADIFGLTDFTYLTCDSKNTQEIPLLVQNILESGLTFKIIMARHYNDSEVKEELFKLLDQDFDRIFEDVYIGSDSEEDIVEDWYVNKTVESKKGIDYVTWKSGIISRI